MEPISDNTVLVFDLDDTLFKEIDYVKSAYRVIAKIGLVQTGIDLYEEMFSLFTAKKPVFDIILDKYRLKLSMSELVDIYRYHIPSIDIIPEAAAFIKKYREKGNSFAMITDGRSVTQRNKLRALGLYELFCDSLYISQECGFNKTERYSFKTIESKFSDKNFIYFADNINKDFFQARQSGWFTVQILDDERNIYKSHNDVEPGYMPDQAVSYADLAKL